MNRTGLPSASQSTWTLVEKPPRERPSASASAVLFLTRCLLMCSNRGRVEHQPFIVHVLQGHEDAFPYASFGPPIEALIDTVPLAKSFGQVPPRGSRPGNPQYRIHELPIVFTGDTTITRFPGCQWLDPLPFRVAQFISSHSTLRFYPERILFFAFHLIVNTS